jgi:hypothetical protein
VGTRFHEADFPRGALCRKSHNEKLGSLWQRESQSDSPEAELRKATRAPAANRAVGDVLGGKGCSEKLADANHSVEDCKSLSLRIVANIPLLH